MNIEKIILELLDRIKTLEEKVDALEKKDDQVAQNRQNHIESEKGMSLIERAKTYINGCKRMAFEAGNDNVILRCGDIQKDLGVTNRVPSVCQAMRDCMQPSDVVLEEPPSGFSTRLTIQYKLNYLTSFEDQNNFVDEVSGDAKVMSLRQLRTGFEDYFNRKKPDYKYPGPLFGMAFYITKHSIGVTLEELFSNRVSLDEYAEILYNHFYKLKPETAAVRTNAYKDAMKNLLEYAADMHLENIQIEK